jgi:predicted DNA-binding protein
MIDLGLIDTAWLDRLPDELAERLKYLLDTPGQ